MPECPSCQAQLFEDYGMVSCPTCGSVLFVDLEGKAHLGEGPVDLQLTPDIDLNFDLSADPNVPPSPETGQNSAKEQTSSRIITASSFSFESALPEEMPGGSSPQPPPPIVTPALIASAADSYQDLNFDNPLPPPVAQDESDAGLPELTNSTKASPASGDSALVERPMGSATDPPGDSSMDALMESLAEPLLESPAELPLAPSVPTEIKVRRVKRDELGPPGDPLGLGGFLDSKFSDSKDGPLFFRVIIDGLDSKEIRQSFREAIEDSRFGWNAAEMMSQIQLGRIRIENVSPV